MPTSCSAFATKFFSRWTISSLWASAVSIASTRRISSSLAISASLSLEFRSAVSPSLLTSSASRMFSVSMNRNALPACAWKMEMQHMAVPARDRYTKKKRRP